ncbi:MAG: uracil-DNA glycosylase [Anaerolineaceae bacterium]|nr:uracil-DNA glycosylase [Anaerolineaceae bacterium]
METVKMLEKIRNEVAVCEACSLHFSRINAVSGEGPPDAKIMFIGEGPGFHENQQGKPFVGAAGKFFDELLKSANLNRNEVFVTNVVKCRPPGNRDPEPEEVESCSHFLDLQIDLINPTVIVTLGRFSMAKYFKNEKISQIHGQAKQIDGRLVIAMYHPAAALHQQSLKPIVLQDFALLKQFVQKQKKGDIPMDEIGIKIIQEEKNDPEPKQLSLF